MHALAALAGPLGQLPVGPPVALIVHLRQVVAGIAPPPHIDRVLIESRIALIEQSRPLTRRSPAPCHVQAQRLSVAVARDEPQFVRMGVPAILAMGDLQRPDQALEAVAGLDALPRLPAAQPPQGVGLLLEHALQAVPGPVRMRQRDHDRLQALGPGALHRQADLGAPALLDLGRTHRTSPDAAAGRQAGIERRVVVMIVEHVDRAPGQVAAAARAVKAAGVLVATGPGLLIQQAPRAGEQLIALCPQDAFFSLGGGGG
jgi:hypothetical protein